MQALSLRAYKESERVISDKRLRGNNIYSPNQNFFRADQRILMQLRYMAQQNEEVSPKVYLLYSWRSKHSVLEFFWSMC